MATVHKSMGELPTGAKVTSVLPSGLQSVRKAYTRVQPYEMAALVADDEQRADARTRVALLSTPPDNRGRGGRSKQQPVRWSARSVVDSYNQVRLGLGLGLGLRLISTLRLGLRLGPRLGCCVFVCGWLYVC